MSTWFCAFSIFDPDKAYRDMGVTIQATDYVRAADMLSAFLNGLVTGLGEGYTTNVKWISALPPTWDENPYFDMDDPFLAKLAYKMRSDYHERD